MTKPPRTPKPGLNGDPAPDPKKAPAPVPGQETQAETLAQPEAATAKGRTQIRHYGAAEPWADPKKTPMERFDAFVAVHMPWEVDSELNVRNNFAEMVEAAKSGLPYPVDDPQKAEHFTEIDGSPVAWWGMAQCPDWMEDSHRLDAFARTVFRDVREAALETAVNQQQNNPKPLRALSKNWDWKDCEDPDLQTLVHDSFLLAKLAPLADQLAKELAAKDPGNKTLVAYKALLLEQSKATDHLEQWEKERHERRDGK